jgi:hypothetical protein
MGMATHEPRHEYRTAAVNNFIAALQRQIGTHRHNLPVGNTQISSPHHGRVKFNKQRIAK